GGGAAHGCAAEGSHRAAARSPRQPTQGGKMNDVSATPIEIKSLTRRFGRKRALDDISLQVPRGCVFGLVGENGAGKTTLIKHLLGLLRAETGTVHVFGVDPVADPVSVLGRIGYLSEQPDLPGWMRVE